MLIEYFITSLPKKAADYDLRAILPVCSTRGTNLERLTIKRAMNFVEIQQFYLQNQRFQG
jgi:hypothetical protein